MTNKNKRDAFTFRLERLINASDLTQVEMAEKLGYDNVNIITMFKKGSTRVPLAKISILAEILEVDPAELIREWLETYMPEVYPMLERHMGSLLSRSEQSWIGNLRSIFGTVSPFDTR